MATTYVSYNTTTSTTRGWLRGPRPGHKNARHFHIVLSELYLPCSEKVLGTHTKRF